jgi:N4-(beta-N-acetylglucosaminyl)-L-asparaginase
MITRRRWLAGSALAPALAAQQSARPTRLAIASSNGERCCARAMDLIRDGRDTLEAVVAGVNINERDPEDSSVGFGGLPNEEGAVELDACVMHGPTRRCGSVASLQGVAVPSNVAKLVLEETDHIMLAGQGALRFAKAYGYEETNLLTEKSRLAWLLWKRSLRDGGGHNNWSPGLDAPDPAPVAWIRRQFPDVPGPTIAWAWEMVQHPPTGTINCLALNEKGEMSGVTTTSGLAWKIPGRVGDSPILGAGLWVDQDVGAAGSTGRGEENIRVAGAHTVVENMRHGMTAREACLDALKRVSRNFSDDQKKLDRFDLSFYALRRDGDYAGSSLWNGRVREGQFRRAQFTVNDGGASRLEDCVFLLERA